METKEFLGTQLLASVVQTTFGKTSRIYTVSKHVPTHFLNFKVLPENRLLASITTIVSANQPTQLQKELVEDSLKIVRDRLGDLSKEYKEAAATKNKKPHEDVPAVAKKSSLESKQDKIDVVPSSVSLSLDTKTINDHFTLLSSNSLTQMKDSHHLLTVVVDVKFSG